MRRSSVVDQVENQIVDSSSTAVGRARARTYNKLSDVERERGRGNHELITIASSESAAAAVEQ